MRDTQRVPRHGQPHEVAGRRTHLQGPPGVAACQLVVSQASVVFGQGGPGPSLPGLVAGLLEQRQGLPGLREPFGRACNRAIGRDCAPARVQGRLRTVGGNRVEHLADRLELRLGRTEHPAGGVGIPGAGEQAGIARQRVAYLGGLGRT